MPVYVMFYVNVVRLMKRVCVPLCEGMREGQTVYWKSKVNVMNNITEES